MASTILCVLALICSTIASSEGSGSVFDGSQVFIYPKSYEHSRIGYSISNCKYVRDQFRKLPLSLSHYVVNDYYCVIGIYDQELKYNQVWILQEHPTRVGFYYVKNAENENERLSYGTPSEGTIKRRTILSPNIRIMTREDFGSLMIKTKGALTNNDLFTFAEAEDGYYYIRPGISADTCATVTKSKFYKFNNERCSSVENQTKAKWKLVPRVKLAKVTSKVLYENDNRQKPAGDTFTLTVTRGVKTTDTLTVRNLQSFKQTVEASFEGGPVSASVALEFAQEIEESLTSSTESSWIREEKHAITVLADKNMAVVQLLAKFEGEMDDDSFTVEDGKIKTFISDDANFYDDNGNEIDIKNLSHLSYI